MRATSTTQSWSLATGTVSSNSVFMLGLTGTLSSGVTNDYMTGFREYEVEAPATMTLNAKVELSIASKAQLLTCAAERQ